MKPTKNLLVEAHKKMMREKIKWLTTKAAYQIAKEDRDEAEKNYSEAYEAWVNIATKPFPCDGHYCVEQNL
jgi:hypothetical protein